MLNSEGGPGKSTKKHSGRDVSAKSTAPGKLGQATVMREVPCGFRPVTGGHNTAHKALREVHMHAATHLADKKDSPSQATFSKLVSAEALTGTTCGTRAPHFSSYQHQPFVSGRMLKSDLDGRPEETITRVQSPERRPRKE